MTTSNSIAEGLCHWAQVQPDRVALRDGEVCATFAEVDAIAGHVAAQLLDRVARGAADPTAFVPVLVARDIWSLIAVHGAIRAGLPFACIDADLPAAEVARRWHRLGASAVAAPGTGSVAPAGTDVIEVPTAPTGGPVAPPQPIEIDASACVIFTSGSTGEPKGVLYDWGMLLGIYAQRTDPRFSGPPQGHCMLSTPVHFLGGLQHTLVLAHGHSYSVLNPSAIGPAAMWQRIADEGVQYLSVMPSLALAMVQVAPPGLRLDKVQIYRSGGEASSYETIESIRGMLNPEATIYLALASSETGGPSLELRIGPHDTLGSGQAPLGLPVTPDRVRLEPLDDRDDSPQEVIVRGMVARGYLGDPELTTARFGTEPDGTRYWRSGDLVVRQPDGMYRHVGRVDDLVKINGKLIEPAEPQRVLEGIPGIRRAVVLPHRNQSGTTRLVAHLELVDGCPLTPEDIRRAMYRELPFHLVPNLFCRHDVLPVTDRFKVDRALLQATEPTPWVTAAHRRTVDAVEAFTVACAAELLGIDDLGPDSNLWELGLDSLRATELAARLSDAGWCEVQPGALLTNGTPAALADLLRHGFRPRTSDVVTLNSPGTRPPLFCVPGAGGTAMRFRWLADALGPDQPVVVIEARGMHAPGHPTRTVEEAAAHALGEIRRLRPAGPVVVAGHSAGGATAYEVVRRLVADGRDCRFLGFDPGLHHHAADEPAATAPIRGVRWWRQRPGQFARTFRSRTVKRYRSVRPGRPTADPLRYSSFFRIGTSALRQYCAQPSAIVGTVFHIRGTDPAAWLALTPGMEAVEVDGDHTSLLDRPHVEHLADLVARQLAECHAT